MKDYLRLLQYARPLRWFSVKYFTFSLLHSIFGVLNFTLLMPLLDILFKTVDEDKAAQMVAKGAPSFEPTLDYFIDYFNYFLGKTLIDYGAMQALFLVCGIIMGSVLLSNIFAYLRTYQSEKIRARTIGNVRKHIFEKISGLHVGFFSNQRKGDLLARSTSDVHELEKSVANSYTMIMREPILITIYFIALFKISTQLTVFALTAVPLLGAVVAIIIRRLKKRSDHVQETQGRLLSILDEMMDGLRIVRAFNATTYARDKFAQENNSYTTQLWQYGSRLGMASPTSEFLGVGIMVGVLLYGGSLILSDEGVGLTGSGFISYLAALSQAIRPIKGLINDWSNVQRGLSAGRRVLELIDAPNEIVDKPDAKQLPQFVDSIALNKVSFAYDNERVLKDVSFTVKKGMTVALVGPSGAGKSTIADLIPRFYDVTEGQILVDSVDVRDYELESLLQQMAVVTQESVLFNDTIFNNIAFGKPDADREEVIAAAKVANAHDFIMGTENGYDTIVGDRGVKLSGGQKQRISIARAIFKNPPILILDEATSALDTESEKLVQDALERLMANRTSIVIAHRLSTIQHADEIIVLEKGEIAERGTHQELLDKDGLYRKLNMMQATV